MASSSDLETLEVLQLDKSRFNLVCLAHFVRLLFELFLLLELLVRTLPSPTSDASSSMATPGAFTRLSSSLSSSSLSSSPLSMLSVYRSVLAPTEIKGSTFDWKPRLIDWSVLKFLEFLCDLLVSNLPICVIKFTTVHDPIRMGYLKWVCQNKNLWNRKDSR